jgi:hypothetical protein
MSDYVKLPTKFAVMVHAVSVMCNCGHATTVYRDRTVCVDHNPDPFTERRDT